MAKHKKTIMALENVSQCPFFKPVEIDSAACLSACAVLIFGIS